MEYEDLYGEPNLSNESDSITISWDHYHEFEEKIEEQYHTICELEDDVEYYKSFVRQFIKEGNKEGLTLAEAYAEMYEYYKENHYDEYIQEDKK